MDIQFDDLDNLFETTLDGDITDSETTVHLVDVPSNSSSGFLAIDADSKENIEFVRFTSKGAGFVSVPASGGRGQCGTTAKEHLSGAVVRMYVVREHIKSLLDKTASLQSEVDALEAYNDTAKTGWIATTEAVTAYKETKADGDINTSTDQVTVGVDVVTGTPVMFLSNAPTGITAGTVYYAIRVDSTHIKFATTAANALSETAVDITAVGTGTRELQIMSYVTVTSALASLLSKGAKLKVSNNSTVKYFHVVSISGTTIGVVGNVSLENDDIESVFYSYYDSPVGFTSLITYSPYFSISGTKNFGNATLSGKYSICDSTVIGWAKLKFGSTTTWTSGSLSFNLPIIADLHISTYPMIVDIDLMDASGPSQFQGKGYLQSTKDKFTLSVITISGSYLNTTGLSSTVPFTFAVNDEIVLRFSYQI